MELPTPGNSRTPDATSHGTEHSRNSGHDDDTDELVEHREVPE